MSEFCREYTVLNKIEKWSAIAVAFFIVYRLLLGTLLDFFMMMSITLLAVFYLWFGFFLFNRTFPHDLIDRRKRSLFVPFKIIVSILMGLIYSICLIAILFGFSFFPPMQSLLWLSLILLLCSTSYIIFNHWIKKGQDLFSGQFYIRSAMIGGLLILMLAVPLNTRLQVLYRKHPDFIAAYKEYRDNPDNPQTLERLKYERSRFR